MKSTGIVRRIDDLGRVVIPKELRRTRGIKTGDPMEVFVTEDAIALKKFHDPDMCIVCDRVIEDAHQINDRSICYVCIRKAWAVIQGDRNAES